MTDKREELVDKMNNGVGRLSPISHKLYFSLCYEFLTLRRGDSIKTSLRKYANYVGIRADKIPDIIKAIEIAFKDIHLNTFHKYQYTLVSCSDKDDANLVITRVDNAAEIKHSMEIIGNSISADSE